jgi:hypothetical protein
VKYRRHPSQNTSTSPLQAPDRRVVSPESPTAPAALADRSPRDIETGAPTYALGSHASNTSNHSAKAASVQGNPSPALNSGSVKTVSNNGNSSPLTHNNSVKPDTAAPQISVVNISSPELILSDADEDNHSVEYGV